MFGRWPLKGKLLLKKEFPKGEWILFQLAFLTYFDFVLLFTDYTRIFSIIGIILDVIGAVIIVLPDIYRLEPYIYSGHLTRAKEQFRAAGTRDPIIVRRKLRGKKARSRFLGYNYIPFEGVSYFINSSLPDGEDWDNILAIRVHESDGRVTAESLESEYIVGIYELLKPEMEREIRRFNSKLRRIGAYTLILGFSHQLFYNVIVFSNI